MKIILRYIPTLRTLWYVFTIYVSIFSTLALMPVLLDECHKIYVAAEGEFFLRFIANTLPFSVLVVVMGWTAYFLFKLVSEIPPLKTTPKQPAPTDEK